MNIRSKILIGLVVVGLTISAVAGISFAASGARTPSAKSFVAGCQGYFGGALDQVAKLLKLKPEQVVEKRQKGESLAAIAQEQGVSQDKVVSTILKSRKKVLDERVKAGAITKEQADAMLKNMKTQIENRIQNPAAGPGCANGTGGCGAAGGGGCGMGNGGCGMMGAGAGPTYSATPGGSI